jgi:hypothetical protein
MMSIKEIEAACEASQVLDFSRHPQHGPELTFCKMFYPLGFPAEVRTNDPMVLEMMDGLWGKFQKEYDTEPIISEVYVVESDSTECPPEPVYRGLPPLLLGVADRDNYTVVDLARNVTRICLSRAAMRHPLYASYFFLGTPGCNIATQYTTPVHAGCVALDGRGVLLCGDSGAGKSTLSYACARAGWSYIADDGSNLLNEGNQHVVIGDCHKVRFRPEARELFPETRELEITPRAAGKPSIEWPTSAMPHMTCVQKTEVNFIVYLNRDPKLEPGLVPFRKDVARYSMRQIFYGPPETLIPQYQAIERLLELDVYELRYTKLDDAIERLTRLVREGR